MDPSQKRRLSRSQENSSIEKPSLPLDNHTKSTNESHYIKNKTLQSPVNRYKVNFCSLNNSNRIKYLFINNVFPKYFQELEEKTIKNRSQLILSSLTHSNTELNSVCPHKESTKSKRNVKLD